MAFMSLLEIQNVTWEVHLSTPRRLILSISHICLFGLFHQFSNKIKGIKEKIHPKEVMMRSNNVL